MIPLEYLVALLPWLYHFSYKNRPSDMVRKLKFLIFLHLTSAGGIGMTRRSQQKSRVALFLLNANIQDLWLLYNPKNVYCINVMHIPYYISYNLTLLASESNPLKTCDGLKSLGYCHPDYPWAFQNGKKCCSCGRQNQKQAMGKRFFQKDHYFSEINYKLLIEWIFYHFLKSDRIQKFYLRLSFYQMPWCKDL